MVVAMIASVQADTPVAGPVSATAEAGHPRIWMRPSDVPALRAKAHAGNALWQNGLLPMAEELKARVDSGQIFQDDKGSWMPGRYELQSAAQLLAFMSVADPDPARRDGWGRRARQLVMHVVDRALTPQDGTQFHTRDYAINYRGNFHGDGLPTAVDWAHDWFSADDKAKIRRFFLRHIAFSLTATTSGLDHPSPVGVVNDPALLSDLQRFRTSLNNFSTSHMRNITLMALALDPADDPPNLATDPDNPLKQYRTLRDFVGNATGAWLYMVDAALKRYADGGVPPEGFEYNGSGSGRIAETLLALYTAGHADPAKYGPQVLLSNSGFWDKALDGYLHSISPVPVRLRGEEWRGDLYLPANFGDIEQYWVPDQVNLFGPLALFDRYSGRTDSLAAKRWAMAHTGPGGAGRLASRAGSLWSVRQGIFHFLMHDPGVDAADPRAGLATHYHAPGAGLFTARTGWGADDRWFQTMALWNDIDHQHGNAGMLQFWRKGEWITKEWSGYGYSAAVSGFKNTLAIGNTPHGSRLDFLNIQVPRGSQVQYSDSGDPSLLSWSVSGGHAATALEMTNRYNTDARFGSRDVVEASRTIIWLKPDRFVIHDRAETLGADRLKQFWLNFENAPTIAGRRATAATAGGQRIALDSLLPAVATMALDTTRPDYRGWNETAVGEPMTARIKVEATGAPKRTTFLHVLQAADNQAGLIQPTLVHSTGGDAAEGALVGDDLVLFRADIRKPFAGTVWREPARALSHTVAGLVPGGAYGVAVQPVDGEREVAVVPGGALTADAGGVLRFTIDGSGAVSGLASDDGWHETRPISALVVPAATTGTTAGGTSGSTGSGGSSSGGTSSGGSSSGSSGNSAPAVLASLVVGGQLSPAFDPAVKNYTLTIAPGTSSVAITPTVNDATVDIYVQSGKVASGGTRMAWAGKAVVDIVLYRNWTEVGRYTLTIQTSGDGSAAGSGSGTSTTGGTSNSGSGSTPSSGSGSSGSGSSGSTSSGSSGGSGNAAPATLTSLVVGGQLSPSFNPAVKDYTLTISPGTGSVSITPTANDPTVDIYVQSGKVTSGGTRMAWAGKGVVDIVLYRNWAEVGRYTLTIQTSAGASAGTASGGSTSAGSAGTTGSTTGGTAPSGGTTATGDASQLASLTIPGLSPAFNPAVRTYTVANTASGSLPVRAVLNDPSVNLYIQSGKVVSGATVNAWLGKGTIDIVLYRGWTEIGRYTVTVTQ